MKSKSQLEIRRMSKEGAILYCLELKRELDSLNMTLNKIRELIVNKGYNFGNIVISGERIKKINSKEDGE